MFGRKSNDDEDEGTAAPVAREKAAPGPVVVAAAKPAESVPTPRSKPAASTLQLASADMQTVQPGKSKQAADKTEAKPQTPADIINARGFWGDTPATPKQATPAQVAAINARQAVASADPQPTASVPAAYQAMAYATASTSPVDAPNIVAASAPIPRSARRVEFNRQHHYRSGRRQGHAGPGWRGGDLDTDRRFKGRRCLDARHDAGTERQHVNVRNRAWRCRSEPE